MEKGISDFRAAGVSVLNPEMFTEIEFETNKKAKNLLTRNLKETVAQRVMSQHTKCGKV